MTIIVIKKISSAVTREFL